MSGADWLCPSCGIEVSGKLKACHLCNALRPGVNDWICNVCTFVNGQQDTVCQMCLSERPRGDLSPRKDGKVISEKTWSCESCGYHNTNTACCRMCGFVKGDDPTPQHLGGPNAVGMGISGDMDGMAGAQNLVTIDDDDDEVFLC